MIPVDIHHHFRTGDQQIAVHVDEAGDFLQALLESAAKTVQLIQILRLQRVLVETARLLPADAHQRRILIVRPHARDGVRSGGAV